jgi:hypothetical protein
MITRHRRSTSVVVVAAALVLTTAVATTPAAGAPAKRSPGGTVGLSGGPVRAATVDLLATDPAGSRPTVLGTTTTDAAGRFTVPAASGRDPDRVLYLVARHPSLPVTLVAVMGADPLGQVAVNERTTVAAAYAFARFATGTEIAGSGRGVPNAVGMAHHLADPVTGDVGRVLARFPNGNRTETLRTFNSLTNMVASCATGPAACAQLLRLAATPEGVAPADTFTAVVNIARDPWQRVDELYDGPASAGTRPNQPARTDPPAAWTLALRFVGDGRNMNGPGNFAIDHLGSIWVTNNYEFSLNPFAPVCGSTQLLRFTHDGRTWPGSPYAGGGVNGAGFGIDIDPYGDVWVGNFGFFAQGCTDVPPSNSVSQFRHDGTAVSPDGDGWAPLADPTAAPPHYAISLPQGTVSNDRGDIWIANCGTGSLTILPEGDPGRHRNVDLGLVEPFDIDVAPDGTAFVTGAGSARSSGAVAVLDREGNPVGDRLENVSKPLGVATDRFGNAWVANSGVITLPCDPTATAAGVDDASQQSASVTLIAADGAGGRTATMFHGGGLTVPWGIAVDGADNVWVANFGQRRLSQFCGASATDCRPGTTTGAPISPDDTGYAFDGLVRNTGVAVDPSGNVWLANNWKERPPVRENAGGYEIVAFVGLGEPVQRPAPLARPPA